MGLTKASYIAAKLRISNRELADITGLNESIISKVMSGKQYPYPKQAALIASALNYCGTYADLFAIVEGIDRRPSNLSCPFTGLSCTDSMVTRGEQGHACVLANGEECMLETVLLRILNVI